MSKGVRPVLQLVVAGLAVVGCVLSWLVSRSSAVVAPILPNEPETVSTLYSPPLMVLSLLFAAAAGVLLVLGVAGLRRRNG